MNRPTTKWFYGKNKIALTCSLSSTVTHNALLQSKNGSKPSKKPRWTEKEDGPTTNDKFQMTNLHIKHITYH
jgi:hypothetical protein